MPKVLISAMTLSGVEAEYAEVLRSAGFELIYPPRPVQLIESEMAEMLEGIYATLAGSEPYTRKVLNSAPQLRVIARMGVGYDAVDLAAATEHGVAVTFTPGTNHDAVAELAFAPHLGARKRPGDPTPGRPRSQVAPKNEFALTGTNARHRRLGAYRQGCRTAWGSLQNEANGL